MSRGFSRRPPSGPNSTAWTYSNSLSPRGRWRISPLVRLRLSAGPNELQPLSLLGGRNANYFGSENTPAGDRAARAERQASAGARREIHVAVVYARLSPGSQARARRASISFSPIQVRRR